MILKEAVHHSAAPPDAYPVGPFHLRVTLRARRGDLERAFVIYGDRYERPGREIATEMERAGEDERFDYFQATLTLEPPRFRYAFLLWGRKEQCWLCEKGFSDSRPRDGFFQYPYIAPADLFDIPGWARGAVFYHIFPERFANGDPANDPPGTRPWRQERPRSDAFYGGDLKGILQRLDHIKALGVDAIYLNPIFRSPSNHKYDTADYYAVDPHFGTIGDFKELVAACHASGIRVVLDAVFNHCGSEFFAFKDVLEKGADSKYAGWFYLREFPVRTRPEPNYETFANGVWTMPKLRTENPEVREYLLGVARYWIEECDIDGWRLDVANEVDHAFWRDLRKVVRKAKPDCYIVGEVWHRALPWLLGDQFDGVMNYPVRDACVAFFAERTADALAFDRQLTRVRMAYPEPVNQASWNLLGSHDTARFLTLCNGETRRAALAAVFLMTYVGAPVIYYGDEVGMGGETDPDCRRPMIWDPKQQNRELLALYRRLGEIRKSLPCLRTGAFRTLLADPVRNVYAYWRGDAHGDVIVALNNSDLAQELAIGLSPLAAFDEGFEAGPKQGESMRRWIDLLTGEAYPSAAEKSLRLALPPLGAAVFHRTRGRPEDA